jgi:hypothetical protein
MARTSAVDTSRTYCGVSLRGGLYEGHGRLYFSHWSLCRGSCCLFGSPYHDQSVLVNFEQACISAPPFQPSCHQLVVQCSSRRLQICAYQSLESYSIQSSCSSFCRSGPPTLSRTVSVRVSCILMEQHTGLHKMASSRMIKPQSAATDSLCSSCSLLSLETTLSEVVAIGERRDLSETERKIPLSIGDVSNRDTASCAFCRLIHEV